MRTKKEEKQKQWWGATYNPIHTNVSINLRNSQTDLPGQFAVAVRNMRGLLIGEGIDDLSERGERLVDGLGFLELLSGGLSLADGLGSGQIHQDELAALGGGVGDIPLAH
jgi:hypothetical protein